MDKNNKNFIISSFEKHFSFLKDEPIALYGIGIAAEVIVENFSNFSIVALLDRREHNVSKYGINIIPITDLIDLKVKNIIIAAKKSNVSKIYSRIADFCEDNEINVYFLDGSKIDKSSFYDSFVFPEEKYADISFDSIKKAITEVDIISFDMFDTLVMRNVLYPTDVFCLMEDKINGTFTKDIRAKAERTVYEKKVKERGVGYPKIDEIYEEIKAVTNASDDEISVWKQLELDTEKEALLPRNAVFDAYRFAIENGKTVYVVSDMYWPNDVLDNMLSDLGLEINSDNIIVSCDFEMSKRFGLFDELLKRTGGQSILHIGDNKTADVESAKKAGIRAFKIESAVNMLSDSYALSLLNYTNTLGDRIIVGDFISKQLNNPFLFSETKGKLKLDNAYELGNSFVTPFLIKFANFLFHKVKELDLDHVLFASRDGYILDKIIDELDLCSMGFPPKTYFYTSRMVAGIAGIIREEDIMPLIVNGFHGDKKDLLRNRFRLLYDEMLDENDIDSTEAYVLKHKHIILSRAESFRSRYKSYLSTLSIKPDSRVAFVDFMAMGTCQNGLQNFCGWQLYGVYFARNPIKKEFQNDLRITRLLEVKNIYSSSKHDPLENMFFLELVLSSPEQSVVDFSDNGKPIFTDEYRTDAELRNLETIHTGILDAVRNLKKRFYCFEQTGTNTVQEIIRLLNDKCTLKNGKKLEIGNRKCEFSKVDLTFEEIYDRSFRQ